MHNKDKRKLPNFKFYCSDTNNERPWPRQSVDEAEQVQDEIYACGDDGKR